MASFSVNIYVMFKVKKFFFKNISLFMICRQHSSQPEIIHFTMDYVAGIESRSTPASSQFSYPLKMYDFPVERLWRQNIIN